MEKMTREQMIAEFGEPGVQNPAIVDLIELDASSGQVALVMIERRGWDSGTEQFRQIEEKINRYMGYVLDGHLATHYPQYRGQTHPDPPRLRRGASRRIGEVRECGGPGGSRAWSRVRRERHARHVTARANTAIMRLADKVIIVTGGASGMGRAYCLGLAAAGARVVIADIEDPQTVVAEITATGAQALGVGCDVSREDDTRRLAAETLARFGRIDVLVNNAAVYGTLTRRPFTEISVEEWDRVMAVNLRGLFLCAQAVCPAMKSQGKGKIINISSAGFFKGVPEIHPLHHVEGGRDRVHTIARPRARGVRDPCECGRARLHSERPERGESSGGPAGGKHPLPDAQARTSAGRRRWHDRVPGRRRQ